MKRQFLKKNVITIFTLMISLVGFSQDNNSFVDAVFRVTTNSINKNNYYLTCGVTEGNLFKSKENKNVKWQKYPLEILWEIPGINLETSENLSWENVNWNDVNSNPNTCFVELTNNIPNGKWSYKNSNTTIIGYFIDGLAHGKWDKTVSFQNKTKHIHQEFINGMPNGEWYEEIDGIKQYSHNFVDGRPNGIWIDNFGKRIRETEYKNGFKNGIDKLINNGNLEYVFNYSNGIPNGEFYIYYDGTIMKKGSFLMGEPDKIWEIYNIDKTSKLTYLAVVADFTDSTQVKITKNYPNSKLKQIDVYVKNQNLIIDGKDSELVNCNQNDGVCDKKTTTYFPNGNIDKIIFSGSNEYLSNKRFTRYYENGKIRCDGFYGQKMSKYDSNGKLTTESQFDINSFVDFQNREN